MNNSPPHSSLSEHLEDLRRTLIRIFCVIGIGFLVAFCFYSQLFSFLTLPTKTKNLEKFKIKNERIVNTGTHPALYHLPQGTKVFNHSLEGIIQLQSGVYTILPRGYLDTERLESTQKLAIFGPIDGFSTIFKLCFWTACIVTSPFWLFFTIQFITPALTAREKHLATPFFCLSILFLTLGASFAYFITIPFANDLLWDFNARIGENLWSLSNYLNFTIFFIFSHALAFEIALVFFILVHKRVLSREWLIAKRKITVAGSFVLGALLTPPDIISQIFMALLLIALYEVAIFYAWLRDKRSVEVRAFPQAQNH